MNPAEREARRILVVDDNADAADSLAMLLEVRGDQVRIAYDGVLIVAITGGGQDDDRARATPASTITSPSRWISRCCST